MEEFVNTFRLGMNSDFSTIYQPDGTYRYMKNCQLMSVNGNNYTITDCMGNVRVFNINIPYSTFTAGTPNTYTYQTPPMPIGFISFPDKLIVLSTNWDTDAVGGYGEIGMITYKTYGEGIQPSDTLTNNLNEGYTPLYHHASLNFTRQHKVEGFAFPENEITQSIYWTDYFNEPRTFNVANPIFTTYITNGTVSLTAGVQYMVLEGVVEYPPASATYYGPGLATGNIFTSNGVNAGWTNKSGTAPAPLIIDYFPYQLLSFTPSRSLSNIRFDSYGSGTLYCGNKIYFYRLGRSSDNYFTSWSYGSSPIHVGTTNSPTAIVGNVYENWSGAGTSTALALSTLSVKTTYDNIDTNFDIIEGAVAEYDQSQTTPRQIIKFISTTITGSSMTLEHTGSTNLGTITLSELSLFPAWVLKCKTLATDKNYILAGNLTERTEVSYTSKGTVTQIQHNMPVHEYPDLAVSGSALNCANTFLMTTVGPVSTIANPALAGAIWPYTQWYVSVGVATYNGVAYGPGQVGGQVFQGVPGTFAWVNTSGTAVVRPCVSRNKYTALNGGAPTNRPDYILLKGTNGANDFWDYKSTAVASHVQGLWNGEKYRYGIMAYDLKGNPFYVQHIGDLDTAYQDNISGGIMFDLPYNVAGDRVSYLSQTGASISGIKIPKEVVEQMSGFSIVRAERDKRIITQGMICETGNDGGTNTIRPCPYVDIQDGAGNPVDRYGAVNNSPTYYSYICPDSLVNYNSTLDTIAGAKLEEASWVGPIQYNTGGAPATARAKSANYIWAAESKYFYSYVRDVSQSRQTVTIEDLGVLNEKESKTNFGGAGITFDNNDLKLDFATGTYFDNTCNGGAAGNMATAGGSSAVGGRRVAIKVTSALQFTRYGFPALDYNKRNDANTNSSKILANFVVTNPTQYGGTGASALANTLYVQCGHFQPINAQVIADCNDTNNSAAYNYLQFDNVEVWGGDAFTCLVDYGHSLYDVTVAAQSYSWGFKFPCQSEVNYAMRRGATIMNQRMYDGTNGISYNPVLLEGFSYNPGYSSDNTLLQYPALPVNYVSSGVFKQRIRYAGPKIIGELENSFRTFLTNNYHDLNSPYGEINNIRERDARVIVWQNKAVVTVPILERQLLSAQTGADTVIGTGGVVDRYDPLNSAFGNQHQHGLTETDFGFVWFDMRKKAFMVFDISQGIIEESKIGGMKGFFDEIFLENLGVNTLSIVLNSPTYDNTSDRPLVGTGIIGVYDPKLKMTYLTFKFDKTGDYLVIVDGQEVPVHIAQDFTIGYYHIDKMFIGFFDMNGCLYHNHNQSVLMVNDPKDPNKHYGPQMTSTDFVVGDVVGDFNIEYVCIKDVTIPTYDPTQITDPAYPGSIYWTAVNQTNEIWVLNQPTTLSQTTAPDYQFNKFFGKVVDNEVKFVVNPKNIPDPFSVEYVEMNGNDVRYTDVTYTGSRQTASDNDIQDWDRNYFFIDSQITANVPLSTTGRIVDNYLEVTLTKKNYDGNPTILTKANKILQWFSSFFEFKR